MDHVSPQPEHDADGSRRYRQRAITKSGAGKRLFLLALCLVFLVLFTGLGLWQVQRRTWKLELIARVDQRVHAPPEPAPGPGAWPSLTKENAEYRHVRLAGRLLNDRETLVQAVTELGGGYWVMTPLQTSWGTVLVNRGFVPPERSAPATRRAGELGGTIEVIGLLRMSEPGGAFLRHNSPAGNRWYSRDVAAIARARGLSNVAPYFVDADAAPLPGGWPKGGLTVVAFRNAHLQYAITWFALAFLSAWGAFMVWKRS